MSTAVDNLADNLASASISDPTSVKKINLSSI